jgi:hypothetical protein
MLAEDRPVLGGESEMGRGGRKDYPPSRKALA